MSERSQIPGKDIHLIEIKFKPCPPLEKIEEEIRGKLSSQHVKDLLCTPGDEVVIRLRSEGN